MSQSENMEARHHYVIGIDLGTTNSAVAYVHLTRDDGTETGDRTVRFLEIPQLVATGETAPRPILPSFLYLPGEFDLPPGATALPWAPERKEAVGEFAREQGALVPGRLVSSAKSWLAHGGVDRTSPILPWGESSGDRKLSPVQASARYLQHIRESWNEIMARGREGYALENQLVVITVPASFDEVARELTVSAGREAGIPRFVLLEEPLAAFYSWITRHEADWQKEMRAGQLILVCDVGGGTTDFTAVAVREGEQGLRFDRLAVGDHLILGGDNMDLALARYVETRLAGKPGKLETKRWTQLVHQCRKAKETLLSDRGQGPSSMDITIMGTGGRLIAGTLKTTITRAEVEQIVMDGFFPVVGPGDVPKEERRAGLTEWGLPYVQDPAITRHLAAFWKRFRDLLRNETGREAPYPDFLLFNGGALIPAPIRRRIQEVVSGWFRDLAGPGWTSGELDNPHPELAVAIGAAYYGLVRVGEGIRVGAGSPRAYYVEVAAGDRKPPEGARVAVCLVPRGAEEGFETRLKNPSFELLTNQPVSFQLLSSSTRLGDRQGGVVELNEEEISAFPPIRTVLRYGKKAGEVRLPVELSVRLTAVGTLELWCESQQTPHRWQLQFDVRQERSSSEENFSGEILEQALIDRAIERIEASFQGESPAAKTSLEPLAKELEEILGIKRPRWSTPLARKLADTLLKHQESRRFSSQHEARWFNLLGFCLRPGFGDPVDEWRMNESWKVFLKGMFWPNRDPCRIELWIFLRRIAGGLNAGRQLEIYKEVSPALKSTGTKKTSGRITLPKRLSGQEETELWMALANCERLSREDKVLLGRILLQKMRKKARPQDYWALSRFGARVPLYGPLNRVIPAKEASAWIHDLLSMQLPPKEAVARALVQLARLTGDRERDVPEEDRKNVSAWLEGLSKPAHFLELLMNSEGALTSQDQDWVFGESLPAGLVLAREGDMKEGS